MACQRAYCVAQQAATKELQRLAGLSSEMFPELPLLHPDVGIHAFRASPAACTTLVIPWSEVCL